MCPRHRTERRQRSVRRSKWKRGRTTTRCRFYQSRIITSGVHYFQNRPADTENDIYIYIPSLTSGGGSGTKHLIETMPIHLGITTDTDLAMLDNIDILETINNCYLFPNH